MNEALLLDLMHVATSGELTKQALNEYARRYSEGGGTDGLLSDLAVFICRRFLSRDSSFHDANAALNRLMPTAGWEPGAAPLPFWEAYTAFEDFELSDDPDEEARPRVEEVLARIRAV